MSIIFRTLKKYFGFESFKQGQFEIINNILNKKDVFTVLPTGGGKSICYQIPAVLFSGVTIVISPLISLMKDQVDNLNNIGISAIYINSTLNYSEINNILKNAMLGKYKLIYIAPERLELDLFKDKLSKINISQIAIDEAHCVSQWGHDFRKSYRSIEPFFSRLRHRPVITAFTATATKEVIKDSISLLGLKYPFMYLGNIDRENLYIEIHKECDKLEFIKNYLRDNEEESTIIYCATKKEVDGLYSYLKDLSFEVVKYHGGLEHSLKIKNQEEFLFDNKKIMIATNAFGMGIDKPNVKNIIHFAIPKNIESYYQEIGRGGRDGELCKCHLLYNRIDIKTQEYLITSTTTLSRIEIALKKLQSMIEFCEWNKCYKSFLLNYFAKENKGFCNNCYNCFNDDNVRDITIDSQKILSCIYRTRERVGISVLIDILRGIRGPKIIDNKYDELSTFSIMKDSSSKFIKDIINTLIEIGYLDKKQGTYSMVKLNQKSFNVLKGEEKVIALLKYSLGEEILEPKLFELLKMERKIVSRELKVRPYIIFSDSTLIELSNTTPTTKENFMNVRGIGEKKWYSYGMRFLNIIKKYKLN